jgi:hypothetical protein
VSARGHGDFVGAGSLAYPAWEAAHPAETAKTILRNQSYFHGWGYSGSVEGRIKLGPLHLRGRAFYGWYDSQEGLDRRPHWLTVDLDASTEVAFYDGAVLLRPPTVPLAFGIRAGVRHWRSRAGDVVRKERLLTRGAELSFAF